MRSRAKYDDGEEELDFFDPFWMFFADDYSDEDASNSGHKRWLSSSSKPTKEKREDSSGIMGFFMGDDKTAPSQRRMPKVVAASQSKQHYWRRPNPKKEKGAKKAEYGRSLFAVSEEREGPTSSASKLSRRASSKRDGPDSKGGDAQKAAFPNFMEAIAGQWDPFGGNSLNGVPSSDESSVDSIESEESDDRSSVASTSQESVSLEERKAQRPHRSQKPLKAQKPLKSQAQKSRKPQPVEQIVVQFNPESTIPDQAQVAVSVREKMARRLSPSENVAYTYEEDQADYYGDNSDLPEQVVVTARDEAIVEGFEVDEGERPANGFLNLQQLVCCSAKNRKHDSVFPFRHRDKAVQNMTEEELAQMFPKLRMVADERSAPILASGKEFKGGVPPHLQLSSDVFLSTKGPQSVYEYEYERGQYMDVAYNHYGPKPQSLIMVRRHQNPPVLHTAHEGVIIKVEASTISLTDCSIRRGELPLIHKSPLPITPGVDAVGKVYKIDKELAALYSLSVGDTVITLTRSGGNSRYLSTSPDQLVEVSGAVDPAEAACLTETYLSAFQVLHFGQTIGTRYRNNSLKGKAVLIVGSVTTIVGHALVELASVGSVSKLYATATSKQFPHLRSLGIIPINMDPMLWFDQLNGTIDLVLVTAESANSVKPEFFRLLSDRGNLIVVGQGSENGLPNGDSKSRDNLALQLVCKRHRTKSNMVDRTHTYDPFRQWELDLEKCKKDLAHLVRLLEKGYIKPTVLDRIPLDKVSKAQELVESQRHPGGFLVCEPWLRNKKRAVRL